MKNPLTPEMTQCLRQYFEQDPFGTAGAILRLAWLQGLTREEICFLRWEAVDFEERCLRLEGREIPLDEDAEECLDQRWERWGTRSEWVIVSERDKKRLSPESVSRLARKALSEAGLEGVKLMDLRHDFIQRQVDARGWAWAARVSGMFVGTVQSTFAPRQSKPERKEEKVPLDEVALWKVLQREKTTPAGLALWLTWQLGMKEKDIVSLTWGQIDLDAAAVTVAGEVLPLTQSLQRTLHDLYTLRAPSPEDPVLCSGRTGSALDAHHLSRLVRTALIRGGMENTTLRSLRSGRSGAREDQETLLLHRAEKLRSITRSRAAEILNVEEKEAYAILRRLVERGKLVRVGSRYYPPLAVVPPERQWETVRAYLETAGFAYRQELAEQLGLEGRQCTHVLSQMVKDGRLVLRDKRYTLGKF